MSRNNKIVLQKYQGYCIFCGKPETNGVHHFVYGQFGALRDKADKDGIYADICDDCHTMGNQHLHGHVIAESLSKMFGEAVWRCNWMEANKGTVEDARDAFRKRYGRNYY